eukprot:1158793-Pelagomonas_calceolata.AAC.5
MHNAGHTACPDCKGTRFVEDRSAGDIVCSASLGGVLSGEKLAVPYQEQEAYCDPNKPTAAEGFACKFK